MHCENPHCRKDGLTKSDVEKDNELNKLLCHGCFSIRHPEWEPESVPLLPEVIDKIFDYNINISQESGVKAQVSINGIVVTVQASEKSLRNVFGIR